MTVSKRKSPTRNSLVRLAAVSISIMAATSHAGMAEPPNASVPVRGIVRPQSQATISTDLQATVSVANFKEGDRFRKGDVLIEFDCRRAQAELDAADAQALEMRLALDNNVVLDKYKAVGRSDLEISRARVKKSAAEAGGIRARLDQCKVVAPFDGRIAEQLIQAHEMPGLGKPFLTIIEDQALEIELIVPSDWMKWVKPGTAFTFLVDETSSSFAAHVTRLGAAVDPVSQTIKVMGLFDTNAADAGILSGMSGNADFQEPRG
jgi:membrane fusion protein, multidrug efflux system